jgi:hypothetical protein
MFPSVTDDACVGSSDAVLTLTDEYNQKKTTYSLQIKHKFET